MSRTKEIATKEIRQQSKYLALLLLEKRESNHKTMNDHQHSIFDAGVTIELWDSTND